MPDKETYSITEKILLAAFALEASGKRRFSAEDLVVSAWQKFPDAFGLAGYRDEDGRLEHPDSNRVFAEIMGSKPIRERGFLKKVGTKMYQLTEAGREHARLLSNRSGKSSLAKAALPRDIEQQLKRLFTSKAWEKYSFDKFAEINFYDACEFWGISPRSSAIELEGKFSNFLSIIILSKKAVQEKKVAFKHSGYTFGSKELDSLLQLHQEFQSKFQEEIDVIKKRSDERKT